MSSHFLRKFYEDFPNIPFTPIFHKLAIPPKRAVVPLAFAIISARITPTAMITNRLTTCPAIQSPLPWEPCRWWYRSSKDSDMESKDNQNSNSEPNPGPNMRT